MSPSVEIRKRLVNALRLDLIGPEPGLGSLDEVLPQAPSRWYLTGFLVPRDAGEDQKSEEESAEDVAVEPPAPGIEDNATPEPAAAKKKFLPSSMGVSLLVPHAVNTLKVLIRWGDYERLEREDGQLGPNPWRRIHRQESVDLDIPNDRMRATEKDILNSAGLKSRMVGATR